MNKRGSILLYLLAGILVLAVVLFFMFKGNNDNDDVQKDNQDIQEKLDNGSSENVIDVIEDSKKGASLSSIYAYISDVEKEIAINMIEGNDFASGKYSVAQIENTLSLSIQNRPSEGNLCVSNGVVTKGSFKLDSYVISYDGRDANVIDSTRVEDINCP